MTPNKDTLKSGKSLCSTAAITSAVANIITQAIGCILVMAVPFARSHAIERGQPTIHPIHAAQYFWSVADAAYPRRPPLCSRNFGLCLRSASVGDIRGPGRSLDQIPGGATIIFASSTSDRS